jgi:hypothetical protein
MQMAKIKAKIEQRMPELAAGSFIGISLGVILLVAQKVLTEVDNDGPFKPFIDADGQTRYVKDTQHIVLENVQSNMWRDLDNPDHHYWLNGASDAEVDWALRG